MTTIRAAVCHSFGEDLSIEKVNLRAPGPGEVEVTLDAVAICHSDITYMDGGWGGALPAVYGHEAAGTITALGTEEGPFTIGDRVIATLIRSCGTCSSCASGRPVGCEKPGDNAQTPLSMTNGTPIAQGMWTGAFAERVVVHRSQLARVSGDIPMDAACLLSCGVITGIGAVINSAGFRAGQDAVVIGAGGVGLNAIQGAAIAGARRIVAIDMTEAKLDMAMEFGATEGVIATGDAPWDAVHTALGKGADAVFVSVGSARAYETAPRYLAPGGRLVMVGMPPSGQTTCYEPADIASAGQSMIGSKMGDTVLSRDIPWMVDLYKQGRLKLDELISGRWTLDQINEAIADTRTGQAKRNVIVFDSQT